MDCPCKDCENRSTGCHGRCEDYKAWRKELDRLKEEQKKKESYYREYRNTKYGDNKF